MVHSADLLCLVQQIKSESLLSQLHANGITLKTMAIFELPCSPEQGPVAQLTIEL